MTVAGTPSPLTAGCSGMLVDKIRHNTGEELIGIPDEVLIGRYNDFMWLEWLKTGSPLAIAWANELGIMTNDAGLKERTGEAGERGG